jgi:hypothetical protein
MNKLFNVVVITMFLLVAFTGVAFAAQGGMPGAHGVDGPPYGPAFGKAVSELAQEDPAALVEHVTGCCPDVEVETETEGMGLPAAHGVDGKTFGGLVSALAQTDPATLVAHIKGCAPASDYLRR